MFRPSNARLEIEEEKIELPPRLPRYLLIGTVLATVLGWVTSQWHGFSSGTVALFPVLVFFAARILTVQDLRSLSWDVLLLMGGGLCLGTAISESGLADWLVSTLPVDGISDYWLMVIFGSVACFMSSVMSNTATANLILPILLGLQVDSYGTLLLGTAFACSMAMPLPVSTPPNAMAFSTEQISVADMVRPGLLLTIAGVALAFTTGYWWWSMLGL
jgi:sodium-dependent dicarboxylate transporter 2/3/5